MNFYDVVSFEDDPIGDIIEFDDGVCILKFNIYKKAHCFDTFTKLEKFMKVIRLQDYKIIKNGVESNEI